MLNFKNISLHRGITQLFSDSSFTIHRGQKVGLTGANGTGKSSLFAMVRNELQVDEGDFTLPPNIAIAHVAQETQALAQAAIEFVIDGDQGLRQLQQQLSQAEADENGLLQADLHARIDDIEGYTAVSRAMRLLSGLGFLPGQEQMLVNEFSGGWRVRLNLAQALMCRSDLLLLDEPTNHLDLDAVIWLQDWLVKYPGTLMLISHDRDFLDAIADHIVHIEHKKAEIYTGNYSAFERIRAEKLAQQQAAYQKQQQEIAHVQSFIERFRAKATKAKQAQSRIKTLKKMELIARAHVDSPFDFTFVNPGKMPEQLLHLDKVTLGYGQEAIITDVEMMISPGQRIGLLGANGAGKSTLVKCLAGQLAPMSGEVRPADALQIGYFAQHQVEQLQLDESPLWHLQKIDAKASEKDLRKFLGGFAFTGDKALDPVGPFSGGEKARLVLAMLVYQNPNLLLLDEPTNHLDLEMRHALSMALQDYEGALVVISHDRHLLKSVTDTLVLVANGGVNTFDGDLEDYHRWLIEQKNNQSDQIVDQGLSRKEQRRIEAEKRQFLQPLKQALVKAEKQVEQLHQRQDTLEQQLADPTLYGDQNKDQLLKLLRDKVDINSALEKAETKWLDASDSLEQVDV